MSAGTGVTHSEHNPSQANGVHFLQIWIEPAELGIAPGYEQKLFAPEDKRGKLCLLASADGSDGSVTIHQDARRYAALVDNDDKVTHRLAPGRKSHVHVVRGTATVNGQWLGAGDALKITGESEVRMERGVGTEVLLFDLP